jgi:hypothetical protein
LVTPGPGVPAGAFQPLAWAAGIATGFRVLWLFFSEGFCYSVPMFFLQGGLF